MDLEAELDADREEWGEDGRGSDDEKVEAEREQEELERQIETAREVRRFFFLIKTGVRIILTSLETLSRWNRLTRI